MILNKSQAEAVYSAMCALNNVSTSEGIRLSFIGAMNKESRRITVDEGAPAGMVRISVLNSKNGPEYHASQAAFSEAYGLS